MLTAARSVPCPQELLLLEYPLTSTSTQTRPACLLLVCCCRDGQADVMVSAAADCWVHSFIQPAKPCRLKNDSQIWFW